MALRHVVFDTDHRLPGAQRMTHDTYAVDHLLRPAAHQRFVTADERLAFGSIDDQQVRLRGPARD